MKIKEFYIFFLTFNCQKNYMIEHKQRWWTIGLILPGYVIEVKSVAMNGANKLIKTKTLNSNNNKK